MRLYLDSCALIHALDGAEQLRRRTLQQLERYGDADRVISDLVRMECLGGPLRSADQIRLLATDWSLDEAAKEPDQFWEPPMMRRGVWDLGSAPQGAADVLEQQQQVQRIDG
ncbi:MAG: hypothetical protein ACKO8I_11140 [Cyanobacteriota bacterium]